MAEKALLFIDLQYDFLPETETHKSTLPVSEGDKVIPIANKIREAHQWDLVVLSQDWHPPGHKSFSSEWVGQKDADGKSIQKGQVHVINLRKGRRETTWPDHCIQGTKGAEFCAELKILGTDEIVQKGTDPEVDSYSAFADNNETSMTRLYSLLDSHHIKKVFVCGLATDFCVYYSCMDASLRKDDQSKAPYETFLVLDACRGIFPEGIKEALEVIKRAPYNVKVIDSSDIAKYV